MNNMAYLYKEMNNMAIYMKKWIHQMYMIKMKVLKNNW